jgi:hypothetical protein
MSPDQNTGQRTANKSLEYVPKEYSVRMRIGFIWLRIGFSGGIL